MKDEKNIHGKTNNGMGMAGMYGTFGGRALWGKEL